MTELKEVFEKAFPFWDSLTEEEQTEMILGTTKNVCKKKTKLHFGGGECAGVQIIEKGRARIFITSPNGGDITLFRLVDGDVSILSAACMLNGMDVELDMEMETDCIVYTIPKKLYKNLYDENGSVKDYTMEMISEKFSDIMWLFNQFVFSNVASRLAGALLEHRALEGSDILPVTHEVLARDAGTAREVVTRLLKQFQDDGMVRLTRGKVEILDAGRLGKV
ncbi:Crp/Fnr family transcriptional regulator [Mediterraneibacter glycyrrhizinilyticus]|uniref:Crp/Fnr family transcriptional regulator n=1 Tax=Mediterraneibacter glycyrrhizinilyticus TaxID=342942 RepID=UPI00196074F4|nr:Crp/Fnr family transcriptional regulator [Mediterraneibacter glycyrrhizinilyticus]MBM6750906.1 Crp/Fnr family transcriptional regulator [Mediterraneibacter glycyrrhizinilyticus]